MKKIELVCIECGEVYPPERVIYRCEGCGDLLDVVITPDSIFTPSSLKGRVESMWRYRELLPEFEEGPVTMGEGWTRLVSCEQLARRLGLRRLYVKLEGLNPTGSFKDRGMSVGVSTALKMGAERVICASTGNTSASLAAYAARAGLECIVLVPRGKISQGKLFQARLFGSKIYQVSGNFDHALSLVMKHASALKAYILNSINPWRLEGQKTLAYEIWEQLGSTDLTVVVPVGNSGNISAIWKGFKELLQFGLTRDTPRMIGVQASGAAPIAEMIEKELEKPNMVSRPETIATAIRIGKPVNWKKGIRAIRESRGTAVRVTDQEILEALRIMATSEGIAAEPAGASPIAGVKRLAESGQISGDDTVVCIATGNPLKDPSDHLVDWNAPLWLREEDMLKPLLKDT